MRMKASNTILTLLLILSNHLVLGYLKTANPNTNKWIDTDDILCYSKTIGGGLVIGSLTVAAIPPMLGVVGFTSAGITAGTIAAKAMSMAAISNGGGIAAVGLIATCQSVAAAGLGTATKATIVSTVASAYTWASSGCYNKDCETQQKNKMMKK